jgi:hypothetical protein
MLLDTFTSRTSEMELHAVTCLLNLPGEWHYQIATAGRCAGAAYTNNGVPTCQRGTPIRECLGTWRVSQWRRCPGSTSLLAKW